MSELLNPPQDITVEDREFNNFRKSPQHGNTRPARAVIVENSASDPVPVYITDDVEAGVPIHCFDDNVTSPGVEVVIGSHTVPALKQWFIHSVDLICRTEGQGFLKVNGFKIASFRTGAARPRDQIVFAPRQIVTAGDIITIVFSARAGSPINEIESLFQALETTI